jgi:hypothetical protein
MWSFGTFVLVLVRCTKKNLASPLGSTERTQLCIQNPFSRAFFAFVNFEKKCNGHFFCPPPPTSDRLFYSFFAVIVSTFIVIPRMLKLPGNGRWLNGLSYKVTWKFTTTNQKRGGGWDGWDKSRKQINSVFIFRLLMSSTEMSTSTHAMDCAYVIGRCLKKIVTTHELSNKKYYNNGHSIQQHLLMCLVINAASIYNNFCKAYLKILNIINSRRTFEQWTIFSLDMTNFLWIVKLKNGMPSSFD